MNGAYFYARRADVPQLSPDITLPDTPEALGGPVWDILALNREGCRRLLDRRLSCSCETLLLPGVKAGALTQLIQARRVVSVGLSVRDSITFSSFQGSGSLACIQRTLLRTDGSLLEPQELLLTASPLQPEEQLLLLGLRLLAVRDTEDTL